METRHSGQRDAQTGDKVSGGHDNSAPNTPAKTPAEQWKETFDAGLPPGTRERDLVHTAMRSRGDRLQRDLSC